MGEKCVFVSQVHQDEFYKDGEGNVVLDSGGKVLSKKHLHIMAIPAVPDDKHEGYSWRLCADQLTKRAVLKSFHTKLQNFIDNYRNEELGITDENPLHATVLHKQSGDGKTIALSVKQLKEITRATGITIDKSITIERLGEILRENRDIKIHDKELKKKLNIAEEINHSLTKENHLLRESQMDIKILQEKERLLEAAQEHIRNLETELEKESSKIQAYEIKCHELEHENDVLRKELEKQKEHLVENEDDVWGAGSGWDDDVNND